MSRVIEQTKKQKDLKRAEELMKAWAGLQEDKKELQEKLAPITASIKEAELELVELGKKLRKDFDKDKNLVFDSGYIHIADQTNIITNEKTFSWKKFIAKFPDFVNNSFRLADIKKAMLGGDTRQSLVDLGIDMKVDEVFEVKKSSAK